MHANILLALPPHRRSGLLKLLDGDDLQISLASDCQEARQKLTGPNSYDLLIADAEFADGSWQELLQFLRESRRPCEMIVCSHSVDERLWAEVVQCGAYDLLVEPYERQEVHRIVEGALESHYMERFTHMATAAG